MTESTVPASPSRYQGGMPDVITGPNGALADRSLIAHSDRLTKGIYPAGDRIWSAVGFGMSNAVMIKAPEGLIIVETGEGIEECEEIRQAFRAIRTDPLKAILYSHSHYAHGTPAWQQEPVADLQIWGHVNIPKNLADTASEIGPAYSRRARAQFSFYLPEEGPDAMPNQGLGPVFFHKHRPTTRRFVTPTHWIREEMSTRIAGTEVRFVPAPSDSDDTVIIHLPELDCVVNNHIWPVLFNIYTLRGEAYRDPLQLVRAIDRIREMDPMHLVGVHGQPISGKANTRRALSDYRDSIQFIWDQTVRGMNDGLSLEEIVARVRLPARLAASPFIPEHYGEVAYHVRAVHGGLLGWYDMEASHLHRLAPQDEAQRMVKGFGGRAAMQAQAEAALQDREISWALQLADYLVRSEPQEPAGRALKARALRAMAQATTAANTRSVCLTQALELEGRIDPIGQSSWRSNRFQILNAPPLRFLEALRVQLDPDKAAGADIAFELSLSDKQVTGTLHVVDGVARFAAGPGPAGCLKMSTTHSVWADLYSGKRNLAEVLASGQASVSPDGGALLRFFRLFDHVRLD